MAGGNGMTGIEYTVPGIPRNSDQREVIALRELNILSLEFPAVPGILIGAET
jgi:hypothetical protein